MITGVQNNIVIVYPRDWDKEIQEYKLFLVNMCINKHGINNTRICDEEFSFLGKFYFPDKITDKNYKDALNVLRSLNAVTEEEIRNYIF